MRQRVYRGDLSPEGLAASLEERYSGRRDLRVQKLGEGDSVLVQIGHAHGAEIEHAVTVAAAKASDGGEGIVVTVGQRQWITPEELSNAAFWGVIGALFTPWALFMLIWPLSDVLSSTTLPADVWQGVEMYAASRGAVIAHDAAVAHPHAVSSAPSDHLPPA